MSVLDLQILYFFFQDICKNYIYSSFLKKNGAWNCFPRRRFQRSSDPVEVSLPE